MRLLVLWAASLLATGYAPAPAYAAPLGEYFSTTDADAYVEAAVRTLGDGESSIADKDYAVKLLEALDNSSVAGGFKSSACSAVAEALASGSLDEIHHGIRLSSGIGECPNAKTWRASEQVAKAVETRHDLWSLYHATAAAPHLGADSGIAGVLDKVLDLVDPDGQVRSYPGGPVDDGNAFMAAELLAMLVPSTKGDARTIALRSVEDMKDGALESEPALLVQLNRAAGEPLAVKATKLKAMARDLLEASRTNRPKSMLGVYEALKTIEGYPKAPLPITLLPPSPSVDDLAAGRVGLLVTSLLGSGSKIKSASVTALSRADGSHAWEARADAGPLPAPRQDGARPLPPIEVAAGLYTAEFSVQVAGSEEGKSLAAKLPLAVGSAATLSEARVSVSESKGGSDSVASFVLTPGETFPDDAGASSLDGHYLNVALSLKGGAAALPHQVFVRFTHALTGLDTFFVAASSGGNGRRKGSSSDGSEYSVSISLGEETATFLQRSGAYLMAVLVGGPVVTPPVVEELGAIDLAFPVAKERHWPIYSRALLHETDVSLGPLPEKHHTFREPEVRPPAGVSLLFTALILATLVGLGYGLPYGGANLDRVPEGAAGRAWCVAHQACMASIVLLFVTYWAALTMSYTLQVLAVLSLLTTFTGRKALQSQALGARGKGAGSGSKVHTKVD